ncbi:MAG: glycosyltransferase family 4 protein [Bacteroidota bacterium]
MKILYYSPHPNLNLQDMSGYGTHMREIIFAFRKLGHEVLPVIAGGIEKNICSKNIHTRVSFKKILKKSFPSILWETVKDIFLLRKDKQLEKLLLQQIEKFQPDLIYERGSYLQISGCMASYKKKIKHIIEINAPYGEERLSMQGKSLLNFMSDHIEKKQIELSEKVVVVSSALKKYFSEKHKIDEKKFIITPNAVNAEKLKTDENKIRDLTEKFQLNKNFVIGFVGSIFPYHGVDILIKSFHKVKEIQNNCKLLIVGDGETLPLLEALSKKLGLTDSVIFTGNISHSDISNYIELMNICVLPKTNWYCSPVKIFEYGFFGKAIIAPNNVPLKDVITDGESGLLINPNVEELSSAILKLLNDAVLRKKIENNFQRKVHEEHSWEKMAVKILSQI